MSSIIVMSSDMKVGSFVKVMNKEMAGLQQSLLRTTLEMCYWEANQSIWDLARKWKDQELIQSDPTSCPQNHPGERNFNRDYTRWKLVAGDVHFNEIQSSQGDPGWDFVTEQFVKILSPAYSWKMSKNIDNSNRLE